MIDIFNILLLISLFSQPFDPSLEWNSMETEHFSIHYYKGEENIAIEAARLSEDVYKRITEYLEWKPEGKTQIIIVDNQDFPNGYANPFPINTIVIYPSQPLPEEEYYEDWIRELITHEFTHIVQLDRTEGFSAILRKIFGRVIINNAAQPIWFIEGFAVNTETRFTNGGRLNSPHFNMMLKQEVKSGNFKSIDRASNLPLVWPGGITPYLYGSSFVDWLIKEYGKKSIVEYNKHTACGVPFAVNSAARRVFGKDFITLWKEWEKELEGKTQEIEIHNTTPLTKNGQWNLSPTFSPDGKTIAFIRRSFDEYPGIELVNIASGKKEKIVEGYVIPRISWSKDGKRILFSLLDIERNYYLFSNIYEYNIYSKELKKIKNTERGKFPVYTPDGKGILFIKEHYGSNDLCIIFPEKDSLAVLLHNDDHTQYHYMQFSPDGKKILLSIWKKEQGEQVYIFNLSNNFFEKLTNYGNNFSPLWSVKFNGIFYISDRSGLYELYFYSFNDKKTYLFTGTGSKIFYPALSPDEKEMAFSSYTPNGYNICTLSIHRERFVEYENKKFEIEKLIFEENEIKKETHPYNPLPYLIPRWWLPFPVIRENTLSPGFITLSQDILFKHIFFLYGAYFIPENDFLYDFTYTDDSKRPELYIEIKQDFFLSYWNEWIKEKEKNIYISLTQNYTKSIHSLTAGYERDIYLTSDDTYRFSNLLLAYFFSNSLRYPRSIEYERGGYINSTYRFYSKKLLGDYSFHNLETKVGFYLKGPFSHNVLSIKSSMGFSLSDTTTIGRMALGGNSGMFAMHGYEYGKYIGKSIITGTVAYSFPLFRIERGIITYPIYFRKLHARLFSDAGTSANEFFPDGFKPLLLSFGMEVTLSFDLFYSQVPCNITAGVAVTKDNIEPSPYFIFSTNIPYLSHNKSILKHNASAL